MSRSAIPRKITRDILRLRNVDKIDTALCAVNECYRQISEHGNKTMEANLDFNMSVLKANEAVRKALEIWFGCISCFTIIHIHHNPIVYHILTSVYYVVQMLYLSLLWFSTV